MTDQELAARARDGDQDAFEQLVRDNEKRIYTLALRMTGSREDALDLAQDAFFQAWKALPTFQGESSFATWLYRLATNLCLDHLRTQKRRTQSMGPALSLDDEENGPVQVADQQLQPQEAVERSERRRALERALERGLASLPDHHRQVLIMRELSGLSYQEIAQVLDLDLGTVKSRIARARLSLRKILLEDGNFFDSPASMEIERHRKE